eukprot:GEMP01053619.1.p1 GENE.GEMP01053619.1~~GEMP01053619.1.p1  ORF type:complete len:250 (+),score=42.06 GEMP01053619.1:115-864(+)
METLLSLLGMSAPAPPEAPKMEPPKSEIMGMMKHPQGNQQTAQQQQVEQLEQTPQEAEAVAKQDEKYPQMAELRSECPKSLRGCPPGCPTHPCRKNSAGRCEDAAWPRGCPPDGCPYNGCAPGSHSEYQLVPCDLYGQRISTGRLGKWCDDPKHPRHTICVKRLPQDFCAFAKRRPNPLPKDWMSYQYDPHHILYYNPKMRQGQLRLRTQRILSATIAAARTTAKLLLGSHGVLRRVRFSSTVKTALES